MKHETWNMKHETWTTIGQGAEVMFGLYKLGADILFILTGQRAQNASLDVTRFDVALTEATRQSMENDEQLNQRELLGRAWAISSAYEFLDYWN